MLMAVANFSVIQGNWSQNNLSVSAVFLPRNSPLASLFCFESKITKVTHWTGFVSYVSPETSKRGFVFASREGAWNEALRGEWNGKESRVRLASYAGALWARHAILFPHVGGRLRDEPKERLRRRLRVRVQNNMVDGRLQSYAWLWRYRKWNK